MVVLSSPGRGRSHRVPGLDRWNAEPV
jgi:hypothetical protein